MNQNNLAELYENHKEKFDEIKNQIEKDIIRNENYKGIFYEIFPFSYQRIGFNRGKIIKDINNIKTTKNLYIYGFDVNDKIIEVKEGITIEDEFYYQFLFYEDGKVKTLNYDNKKSLQNISYHIFENNRISKMFLKGKRGGREETYFYETNLLKKILIKQFDAKGNEVNPLEHIFEYSDDGTLNSIKKLFTNGNYEIIYKK